MRTLVYKRTHNGDPDAEGRFGIHDCMGQVRSYGYEAVIGVGGVGFLRTVRRACPARRA
jgi:hypothetical protein